jgi:hypothetical protein
VTNSVVIRRIETRTPSRGWWVLAFALVAVPLAATVVTESGAVSIGAALLVAADAVMIVRAVLISGGVHTSEPVVVTVDGLRSRFWSVDWHDVAVVKFWGPPRARVVFVRTRRPGAGVVRLPGLLAALLFGSVFPLWLRRGEPEDRLLSDLETAAGRAL